MTTLSRILGYVRDVFVATLVGAGAGPAADAFFVAFRIPNFLRRLFAEGAFSQAFVPIISEYRTRRSLEEVRSLASHVSGTLGLVLLVVTAVGVVAAPVIIAIFAPGFLHDATKYGMAVDMLRITFPYLLFVSMTAFAGGLLNTYERFGVPALTPVLLNLSIIAGAVWLAPRLQNPVFGLAWGVFLGGVCQLLFQLPFLYRLRLLVRPRPRPADEGVRRILRLMLPAIFGVSVSQINLLLDTLLASFLVTGSISWLYYSDRIVEFPLGVFAIALATVTLPSLSRRHAELNPEAFSATLDWALRWVLLIGLPASVGIAVLAAPTLTALFRYGAFSALDVRMAQLSLVAYSVGLLGFMLVKVLAPGYYARQDTRTPVRIGVIAMVCNMAMNLMLIFTLAHAGLALATSLAAFINAGLLYRGLRRIGVYTPTPGWTGFSLRVAAAGALMAAVLWYGEGELSVWLARGALERVGHLVLLIAAGVASYFVALTLMGLRVWRLAKPGGA
jgi:putative peptidoglycan lipid II flippase